MGTKTPPKLNISAMVILSLSGKKILALMVQVTECTHNSLMLMEATHRAFF